MLPLYLSTLYNLNGKIYSYLKIPDKIILFEFFHPYKGPPYLIMRCRMISLLAYPSHYPSSTRYFVHPSITGTPFGSGRCSDSSAMTPAALCAGGVMPTRLTWPTSALLVTAFPCPPRTTPLVQFRLWQNGKGGNVMETYIKFTSILPCATKKEASGNS